MTSFAVRAALLAGLGMVALTLPAGAAPSAPGVAGTDIRTTKDTSMQLAQRSEERGGNIKGKSKKKKKKAN